MPIFPIKVNNLAPGFEYRMSGGFVFRGGVNFLIKDGFFVRPGIALGIAF